MDTIALTARVNGKKETVCIQVSTCQNQYDHQKEQGIKFLFVKTVNVGDFKIIPHSAKTGL